MRIAFVALLLVACGNPTDDAARTLAPAANTTKEGPVDGISCDAHEQLALHLHAHLAIYDHGEPKLLPSGIGISPGSCIAWLHSHDQSGILHVEAPMPRTFSLGNFFSVWAQPLSTTQVGPATGSVTAFVDGVAVAGDPRAIVLADHGVVQLDVGEPVVPAQPYTFPAAY